MKINLSEKNKILPIEKVGVIAFSLTMLLSENVSVSIISLAVCMVLFYLLGIGEKND